MGGGIARMMGELARRYPPGSLVVSTGRCTARHEDGVFPNVVDRVTIPSERLRTLHGLLVWSHRAAALARAIRPEFVWCGNLKPAAYPARWVRRRSAVGYGVLLYGTDLLLLQRQVQRSAAKRRTARALMASASALVAISQWTRSRCLAVLDQLGVRGPEMEVRVLPLGTDPDYFRPDIATAAVRNRYGLESRRWLLTVARLARHKGVDTGLRVLAQLRARYPDLGYIVAGSGGDLGRLTEMAGNLGVADRVRFLGEVPDRDLPALYNCAEIYLGLSRVMEGNAEGFGLSLVEAGACGIPVVAGRSGGIPDAVREGETGLLVDPERAAEACEAVRGLLDHPEQARRLGQAGRHAVETYYNWNRVAADLASIGHELGSSRPEVRR